MAINYARDHIPKNALFASVLIRAASALASSEGSGKLRGLRDGEPGAEVGGVEERGVERPESDEEAMAVAERK